MKSLSLTLAASLLLAQPAVAADGRSWRIGDDSFHVYYSDLDMNTAEGRGRMLARIERSARRLCDARLRAEEEACVAETIAQAVRSAGGAALRLALTERDAVRLAHR